MSDTKEREFQITEINPGSESIDTSLYFMCGEEENSMLPEIRKHLYRAVSNGELKPFLLVSVFSDDWDHDFSPWEAKAVFRGGSDFSGGAKEMLSWLRTSCIPKAEKNMLREKREVITRGIIGYSLAGLFSLYCITASDLFTYCGSVSGSLWFENWSSYVRTHIPGEEMKRIYLSLGDKEEKTKNALMQSVGTCTTITRDTLTEQLPNTDILYETNPGGHFNMVEERLLKAFLWLLKK